MAIMWKCRNRAFELGRGCCPIVMGILNVTTDSFSDGGLFYDPERAIERGLQMATEGADIIDIGGESTRPGATPVLTDEEIRRVLPVIKGLTGTGAAISIDTSKAEVADAALSHGAHMVNDVSAAADPRMAQMVKSFGAGIVLMHMRGDPRTMQDDPRYENVVMEVREHLDRRIAALVAEGVDWNTIAVDPGIGFGKTTGNNIELIARLADFRKCGRPVVLGLSRKRFLGALTGREPGERLAAGLGALSYALAQESVDVARVHDVKETRDTILAVSAMLKEKDRHALA